MDKEVFLQELKDDLSSIKEDISNLQEYVGLKKTDKYLRESKEFFFAMHKCKTKEIYTALYHVSLLHLRTENEGKFCLAISKILENLLYRSLPLAITALDLKTLVQKNGKSRPAYQWIFDIEFLKSRPTYNQNQLSSYERIHSFIESDKPFLYDKIVVNDLFKILLFKFKYGRNRVIGKEFYLLKDIWSLRHSEAHITETKPSIDLIEGKELTDQLIKALIPYMNQWIKTNPDKKGVF